MLREVTNSIEDRVVNSMYNLYALLCDTIRLPHAIITHTCVLSHIRLSDFPRLLLLPLVCMK